ncbi:unnamed protein product [Rotaria socialis]|uniref:G-protein coupled receptors family 1 profile domain-containing protein n=1 Tax=Rotaria socialis TaxID=392032 RepID=A0A819ZCX5_9BILA|nr:unnamed protein product [Rotaria socialis]
MEVTETSESRLRKFWILLLFQIPSNLCSIFVLHHMFTAKIFRQTLSNHVIIAMLIVSLLSTTVDLSLTLNYLRLDFQRTLCDVPCFKRESYALNWYWPAVFPMEM